ncbi:MAG: hypothetical protein WA060_03135 [Minisyncoccia bacterium]
MGKNEGFSPLYVKKEQEEKERKAAVLERKKIREANRDEALLAAADSAALELALEKIGGEINYRNEFEYQTARRNIQKEINDFLAKSSELKDLLYDSVVGKKDLSEILTKSLMTVYKNSITQKA